MAVLQLERIWSERTITKIFKALDSIPSGFDAVYKETLDRIRAQREPDNTLGIRILQWISQARRPLKVNELRHALALEWLNGEQPPSEIDANNLLNQEDLLGVCGGLVIVEPASQIVQLAHFTVEEFFRNNPGTLPDGSLEISRTCTVALQTTGAAANLLDLVFDSNKHQRSMDQYQHEKEELSLQAPFQTYACCYWRDHNRELHAIEPDLERLSLEVVSNEVSRRAIYHISYRESRLSSLFHLQDSVDRGGFSALHFFALLGISSLGIKLFQSKGRADLNKSDSAGMKPLHYSIEEHHMDFVQILLQHGADANCQNAFGETPLWTAVRAGDQNIIKLLLKHGADVDTASSVGGPSLLLASKMNDVVSLHMLLDAGASIDLQHSDFGNALLQAAMYGREDCIKILVDAGAAINLKDDCGQTALSLAAKGGYTDCVRTLLKVGAAPDLQDIRGRTALMEAAQWGEASCIQILLEQGAGKDAADSEGKTALIYAQREGFQVAIDLLTN